MIQKIAVFIYYRDETTKIPFFLLLRRIERLGGYWQPITGTKEDNETLIVAAMREIAEETGLSNIQLHPEPDYVFTFEKCGKQYQEFTFAAQTNETNIRLSSEHSEYSWLPFNSALNLLFWETNKQALRAIYQKLAAT